MKTKVKNFKTAIIGTIAGIISGLFTSGGGLILVPAFVYILKLEHIKARGTTITCILPMVITSSIFYYGRDHLDLKTGVLCAIGGTIGGIIGARLLKKLPLIYVKIIFTSFLLFVGFRILIS